MNNMATLTFIWVISLIITYFLSKYGLYDIKLINFTFLSLLTGINLLIPVIFLINLLNN